MAPGFLRIGRLHLPVYGVFAAAGLIAALSLSQRAARRVGLDADKVWDAGMFAAVAAFVASRLLLVVFDFRSFLRYPVLVLSLPSLTYAGMVLTAFATWYYLRARGLPWRSVLDAWAPCAAVLAAVLSVGHFVEGTDAGMPTRMPWGMRTAGDSVLGPVHPVQLFEAALALVLGWWFWRLLARRRYAGQVAVQALVWGGVATFLLDFLRQPVDTFGGLWLDAGQFVALASMVAGSLLRWWIFVPVPAATSPDRLQVASILEQLHAGTGAPFQHEIVAYERFRDPLLVEVQTRFNFLYGAGMSEEDWQELLAYVRRLRTEPEGAAEAVLKEGSSVPEWLKPQS